jgi:protein gp37
VWLGITCEDQHHYDRRWPILSEIPAAVHFISYEPALGPLNLTSQYLAGFPDWVICGGGSARYMKPNWARRLRDECQATGIAFFMKQIARKQEIPADLLVRESPAMSSWLDAT